MTTRLSIRSLTGTVRTLVAVGTVSDVSMLDTVRAAAPRNTVCSDSSSSSLPGAATAALFGPVGAGFLAALAEAAACESRAVAALSDSLAAAGITAGASAAAYADADRRAGGLLGVVA